MFGWRGCETCGYFDEGYCYAEPHEYPRDDCADRFNRDEPEEAEE